MVELQQLLLNELALAGLAPTTQEAYLHAYQSLTRFAGAPEKLKDSQIRQYFVYLIKERNLSRSSIKVHLCGLSFLYRRVVGRAFDIGKDIVPRKEKRLPVVLTRPEVQALLSMVEKNTYRTALSTIYACGLRLSEVLALRPRDIDSAAMVIWVRQSKGAKDRSVPLPRTTLESLRTHWRIRRPKDLLFESRRKRGFALHPTSLQRAFKAVVRASSIVKPATIHTLRHGCGPILSTSPT